MRFTLAGRIRFWLWLLHGNKEFFLLIRWFCSAFVELLYIRLVCEKSKNSDFLMFDLISSNVI